MLHRLGEGQDIGLAGTVDRTYQFRRQGDHGGDVDDGAALPRHESRYCRRGKPREGGDVEIDQALGLINIGLGQGPIVAMPALLTSTVIWLSLRSRASIRPRSALLVRSATSTSMGAKPVKSCLP